MTAQGWPQNYGGVMLQGFYWDSFNDTQWTRLEKQADDLAPFFDLVWIPQSAKSKANPSNGYDPLYWFNDYNSSYGNEAQLKSLIKTFKAKGIGTIGDVVINHRETSTTWNDFVEESYNGQDYTLTYEDIVSNDEAKAKGYQVGPNADTGENWPGMRDLDHKSSRVQAAVKAYLKMLIEDFGYTGFRYDMVKGFGAEYIKMYNEEAKPQFSVGECWDGTPTIRRWIDGTEMTSAAFDFQFRYTVRNAINQGDWSMLAKQNDGNYPLVSNSYESGSYRRYAVTFVENHDTEKRANAAQDPIRKDTLAANAYLLAMPGTPCVFLTHWKAYKQDIKAMIDVRKMAGITNMSSYTNLRSSKDYYANLVKTDNENRLIVVVGSNTGGYTPSAEWQEVLSGYKYKYYLPKTMEKPFADKPTGQYDEAFKVRLTAISADEAAQIVYTLDGSEPTAASTKVASGTAIDIAADCILKVGLLAGGTVKSVITRQYTFNTYEKRQITVYVNADKVGWSSVNFWSWGGDGSHSPANSNWPGDKVTATTSVGGKNWFAKQFTLNADDDAVSFVFSTGTGSPQTVDVENITENKFFEISTAKDGDKHRVDDVTSAYATAIKTVSKGEAATPYRIYSLDGRLVKEGSLDGLKKGVYIVNDKKVIVR